jgi:triacylglycerol esterase/lipase EstA (alpha/beta hydrolase family)
MLAQLLRRTLYAQLVLGAVLAYGLHATGALSTQGGVVLTILLPFAVLAVADLFTTSVSRGPEPWGAWLKSLVGEYRAGLVIFILRQPWVGTPAAVLPATGAGTRIPVVLVHGYLSNQRIWDDVTPQLRAQGHAVYAVNLEPLFCSIDQYAEIVEAAVQTLLKHSGQSQVALVGHSMGGLAIRAWLRAYGSSCAARVVTLGTPHVGTQVPQPLASTNGDQMEWGSRWLADLASAETAGTHALFDIALSPQDNIVYPQRAQVLPTVTPTVFEGIGHLQMCLDAAVIAWLKARLAELGTKEATP